MSTNALKNQSTLAEPSVTGSVISKDGTAIGYRQLGHGPGLVVLHGAMESSQSHVQLAEELADGFSVYLPDRRGRGLSGPYSDQHSITQDVEDLNAVLAKTDAHYVAGISSGAIICLQAALTLGAIHKAAIFEPPLLLNGPSAAAWLTRFDREIAQGRVAAALITGMKGAQMGPPIFNRIPRPVLEWLTNMGLTSQEKRAHSGDITMRMLAPTLHYDFQLVTDMSERLERLTTMMLASEDKKAGRDDVTMRMLAPTLHYDFRLVIDMEGALESFRTLSAEVLLLGGSKSPAFLRSALDALEQVVPHVKRVEFPGLGHEASGNTDRRGQPARVAQELRRFFIETESH